MKKAWKKEKAFLPQLPNQFFKGVGQKDLFPGQAKLLRGTHGAFGRARAPEPALGAGRHAGRKLGARGALPQGAGERRRHYLTWSRRLIPAQGYEARQ